MKIQSNLVGEGNRKGAGLAAAMLLSLLCSCIPFTYDPAAFDAEHEKCIYFSMNIEPVPAVSDVTLEIPLPRDHFINVKSAVTYASFAAPAGYTSQILVDACGNGRLSINMTGQFSGRLHTAQYSISEKMALPEFMIAETAFPDSFPAALDPCLEEGDYIPVNDPVVREIARRCRRNSLTGTIFAVADFFDALYYDDDLLAQRISNHSTQSVLLAGEKDLYRTALEVVADNAGACYEKARLGAAVLRACGIPTRIVHNDGHGWNEVYIPGQGWIPIDFSHPERDKIRVFPYEPWIVDNYVNVIAVGERHEPLYSFNWDKEVLVSDFIFHVPVTANRWDVAAIYAGEPTFFQDMKVIAVSSETNESGVTPFFLYAVDNQAVLYREGAFYYFSVNGAPRVEIQFGVAMQVLVDGIGTDIRFSNPVAGYILIER